MKHAKTILLGVSIAVILTTHPAGADEIAAVPKQPQTQIAEVPVGVIRNITAVRRTGVTQTDRAQIRNAHPPGAHALMALGIALIVTPAMFRGAFSN